MEVYYKALLVLSLKVPGEFSNAPKENSPVKACYITYVMQHIERGDLQLWAFFRYRWKHSENNK